MTTGRWRIQTPPKPKRARCVVTVADRRPFGRRYRYRIPAPGLGPTEASNPRTFDGSSSRDRRRRELTKDSPLSTSEVIVIIFSGKYVSLRHFENRYFIFPPFYPIFCFLLILQFDCLLMVFAYTYMFFRMQRGL